MWISTAEQTPAENEQVLVHDNRNNRMEFGRYLDGQWYIEDPQSGELKEMAGVTHWAWILETQTNDDSDDD